MVAYKEVRPKGLGSMAISVFQEWQCETYLPGLSGMSTLSKASRPSPSAARSATNRKRSKFILAPLTTATNFFPDPISWLSNIYLFRPAKASAPAGSVTDRVSGKETEGKKDHASEEWKNRKRMRFPRALCATRRTFEDIFDSRTDLVIVDFDHLIEQLLANSERLFAHDPNRSPIAERTDFRERDALALFQAARHRVPVERLGADNARARTADALDVFGYARDEAAAADGAKNGVEVLGIRELLEDLHPDGALAGDHERVVVRRHKDETVRGGEARALDLGLVKVRAVEDDLGAEARDVAHFDRWRGLRHHDRAWNAEPRAGERYALRVVPWNEGGKGLRMARRSGLSGVYTGRASYTR